jgi:hypothetical protein
MQPQSFRVSLSSRRSFLIVMKTNATKTSRQASDTRYTSKAICPPNAERLGQCMKIFIWQWWKPLAPECFGHPEVGCLTPRLCTSWAEGALRRSIAPEYEVDEATNSQTPFEFHFFSCMQIDRTRGREQQRTKYEIKINQPGFRQLHHSRSIIVKRTMFYPDS